MQLLHLLHHEIYLPAHLLGEKRELYVALVLISVADNHRVGICVYRQHSMQLGLGASLKAYLILRVMVDKLLDDRAHLVHLDGVYDIAVACI